MNTAPLAVLKAHVAKPGRTIIVLGPYCWGKGLSGSIAYRNARSHLHTDYRKGATFAFYDVPEEAGVNGLGYITWKDATQEAVELGQHVAGGAE